MSNRIGWNEYFMNIAVQVSLRSTCTRRKVGAVIVKDNTIISTGYNGSPKGMVNCIDEPNRCYRSLHNIPSGEKLDLCYAQHAEINAIMNAAKGNTDLNGAIVYVTTFPCSSCAKAIIQSGIREIYYLNNYTNEFTLSMFEDVNMKCVCMDASIYNTPNLPNASTETVDDLDTIDPIVSEIYKYEPYTDKFIENRKNVFEKYNLWNRYDENILATELIPVSEMTPISSLYKLNDMMSLYPKNRNELEYNGSREKQLVVGAILKFKYSDSYILLNSISGRLKNKLTMIQGHVTYNEDPNMRSYVREIASAVKESLFKELYEEVGLLRCNLIAEPKFVIQTNDNKISSEHIGILFMLEVTDIDKWNAITTTEPEKHEVAKFLKADLLNKNNQDKMDTWLKKFINTLNDIGEL